MIKSKEYVEDPEKIGAIVKYMTTAEFQKSLEKDRKAVETVARELGVKK